MNWRQQCVIGALLIGVRIQRQQSQFRFSVYKWLKKTGEGRSDARLINNTLYINGKALSLFEREMLFRILSHDHMDVQEAICYILGLKAQDIVIKTLSSVMDQQGSMKLTLQERSVPLSSDIRDLLLQ